MLYAQNGATDAKLRGYEHEQKNKGLRGKNRVNPKIWIWIWEHGSRGSTPLPKGIRKYNCKHVNMAKT